MPTFMSGVRLRQIVAWLILALFLAGFFVSAISLYTGAILGLWFVGTQRPLRGLVWLLLFALVPALVLHARALFSGAAGARQTALLLLTAALGVLPFLFHRALYSRLPGLASTFVYPCAVAALAVLQAPFLTVHPTSRTLCAAWFCALLLLLWDRTGAPAIHRKPYELPAIFTLLTFAFALSLFASVTVAHKPGLAAIPLVVCVLLALVALLRQETPFAWSSRALLPLLRSPLTGLPLDAQREGSNEYLTSPTCERFPIRSSIPSFLTASDLTGANRKYNQLYQTIAGFYDDTQRVGCALTGMDRDNYVRSYLAPLELHDDDLVLETSVGTGLNFQYLPRSIRRVGLDLSAEMLGNCRRNLQRWQMEADLILGNAEHLPFADNAFDAVFHVGGINFFSDRARAIREMLRVAKPGSLLLIADETEEHVQRAYENIPYTREFYKDRTETVAAPIDLLPPEVEDVHVATVQRNRFYVLSFRKPAAPTIEP